MVRSLWSNLLLVAISLMMSAFLAEFLLSIDLFSISPITNDGRADVRKLAQQAARTRESVFDERSLAEVVETARLEQSRSFPAISPAYYLSDNRSSVIIDGEAVLPLGIASHADNYYCNESGAFVQFKTDRFGFRNPDAIWNSNVDIVAIGDSFTMGSCLPESEGIVGNLRQNYKVLNLGMGANGPLIELASLREYGRLLKPKAIVWIFFPNDLVDDLARDRKNKILINYLDPLYTQKLVEKNSLIQKAVDGVVEEYWQRIKNLSLKQSTSTQEAIYKFSRLRSLYYIAKMNLSAKNDVKNPDLKLFLHILQEAKTEAERMAADFLFVYLPDCVPHSYGQNNWKPILLEGVRSIGVEVLDVEPAITALPGRGEAAFFYCPGSHFSPTGAKTVAAHIAAKLSATHSK